GGNNTGQIAPLTAAEIAQVFGIRVYTIGVGTRGRAPHPALDRYGRTVYVEQEVEIDDQVLTEIAAMTGGKYYRATDNSRLQEIYEEIDRLERTEIEVDSYTRWYEKFMPFTLAAFLLLIVEMLLRYFYLRRIP
ncbi:MAG: VWA domain-containing protein, partial [Rikenellaceae bacterium]|nr:VWA domain-containing protein [Rikenellaceae bacterium]